MWWRIITARSKLEILLKNDSLLSLIRHPLARLYLLLLISLPLFHWAHRFRYTLYDGLKLKHLTELIAVICYGSALVGSALAAYTLWSIP